MNTLTTEHAVEHAVEHAMGFTYVLMLTGENAYSDVTLTTDTVTGTVTELTNGLRPWLLAYLRARHRENGWYLGCLVANDEDGRYDTYLSLAVEDVIWYWDEECVPASQLTSRTAPAVSNTSSSGVGYYGSGQLTEQAPTTRPPARP